MKNAWGRTQRGRGKLQTLVEQLTQVRDGLVGERDKLKQQLAKAKQQEKEAGG